MSVSLTGSRRLASPRPDVWAALNDVACLRRCIPACRHLEQVSPTQFRTSVVVRLGPLRVPVEGIVEITASEPPREYRLDAHGHAQIVGGAKGSTLIRLTEIGRCCRLDYEIEAEAVGPIAALGPIALTALARRFAERFTAALADALQSPTP